MSSYLYVLFFALLQKTKSSPSNIFCIIWLKKKKTNKKLLQLNTKWNIPKLPNATQEERKKEKQARV